MFKYTMTFEQYKEYLKLKEETPKINEFQLFTSILGSALCLGKSISNKLGYFNLYHAFFVTTKLFFWALLVFALIKAIEKTHQDKKAGLLQLVGVIVGIIFMLI